MEKEKKSAEQTVKHPEVGTVVDVRDRVDGISTGKNKYLPKKGVKFSAHPIQMQYFIDRGDAEKAK